MSMNYGCQVAFDVTATAHRLGGGSAAYADSSLLRRLRDVQTARQHIMFGRGAPPDAGEDPRRRGHLRPALHRVARHSGCDPSTGLGSSGDRCALAPSVVGEADVDGRRRLDRPSPARLERVRPAGGVGASDTRGDRLRRPSGGRGRAGLDAGRCGDRRRVSRARAPGGAHHGARLRARLDPRCDRAERGRRAGRAGGGGHRRHPWSERRHRGAPEQRVARVRAVRAAAAPPGGEPDPGERARRHGRSRRR